jgi:RNA polymerase sigma-70 factor (ECF subfamily)
MPEAPEQRLSQISTAWTVLQQAHGEAPEQAKAARRHLLQQYSATVYRYLLAATRCPDAADDLYQEFALRFVRGAFAGADPQRGRFRDFLKTALVRLVIDHQRHQTRRPQSLQEDVGAAEASSLVSDQEYIALWRTQLMTDAWRRLAEWERATGNPLNTLLRFRAQHPQATSQEIADQLSAPLAKPLTAAWVRKNLHDARRRFTEFLVEAVRDTLGPVGDLEDELLRLGLLEYCRGYLPSAGK